MKTDIFKCEECQGVLKPDNDREECCDLCDECYKDLKTRTHLLNDPEYRMRLTRQVVGFINGTSNYANHKELKLRGFFATVMPEMSLRRADKLTREILRK